MGTARRRRSLPGVWSSPHGLSRRAQQCADMLPASVVLGTRWCRDSRRQCTWGRGTRRVD